MIREGKNMKIANIIAYVLVILGAVNWGLYGIFNFNLVSLIFGGARAMGAIKIGRASCRERV